MELTVRHGVIRMGASGGHQHFLAPRSHGARWPMRSEEELCRLVEAELAWELGDYARPVAVDVQDGVATLSGTVYRLRDKLAAPDAARRVYGVQDVSDRLRVVPAESDRRHDAELSSD